MFPSHLDWNSSYASVDEDSRFFMCYLCKNLSSFAVKFIVLVLIFCWCNFLHSLSFPCIIHFFMEKNHIHVIFISLFIYTHIKYVRMKFFFYLFLLLSLLVFLSLPKLIFIFFYIFCCWSKNSKILN